LLKIIFAPFMIVFSWSAAIAAENILPDLATEAIEMALKLQPTTASELLEVQENSSILSFLLGDNNMNPDGKLAYFVDHRGILRFHPNLYAHITRPTSSTKVPLDLKTRNEQENINWVKYNIEDSISRIDCGLISIGDNELLIFSTGRNKREAISKFQNALKQDTSRHRT
jgi:hypothetical protein